MGLKIEHNIIAKAELFMVFKLFLVNLVDHCDIEVWGPLAGGASCLLTSSFAPLGHSGREIHAEILLGAVVKYI